MRYQHTLEAAFSCHGVGLHTGREVNLTVRPAPADTGIRFVRTDLGPNFRVTAGPETVSGTSFATTVSGSAEGRSFYISTVEHLMSALVGMGVDNAVIETDGDEIPILDGSAGPFALLIESAGVRRQPKLRRYLEITRPIIIREEGKSAALYPYKGFRIECEIDFDHPAIKTQNLSLDITPDVYRDEIAPARTFGFLSDLNILKANGFAAGGSLDNAVVLGNYSVINKGGLRFPDEFVRHKILDAVGDLYLAGMPILGRFVAHKSGHGLNNRIARLLMSDRNVWRTTTYPEPDSREFSAGMPVAAWAR